MTNVNVIANYFLYCKNTFVKCKLKSLPDDFIVREISNELVLSDLNTSSEYELSPAIANHDHVKKYDQIVTAENDEDFVSELIGQDKLRNLSILNNSVMCVVESRGEKTLSEKICIEADIYENFSDKIYNFVRDKFPFLSAQRNDDNNGAQFITIDVKVDESFYPLISYGLSLDDLRKLYQFRNFGPSHTEAHKGILIGKGIDKENRTKIYQLITKCCKSFDSKTIERNQVRLHVLILNIHIIYMFVILYIYYIIYNIIGIDII